MIWIGGVCLTNINDRVNAIFAFVIISLFIIIPPLYIYTDSLESKKDASKLVFISIFLSYYAIAWYYLVKKNLKDFQSEEKH
jgi:hypothetical protein